MILQALSHIFFVYKRWPSTLHLIHSICSDSDYYILKPKQKNVIVSAFIVPNFRSKFAFCNILTGLPNLQPRYWLFLGVPYLYTVVTDNKHDTTTTLVDFAGGDMCFWHIDIYIAIETNA